MACISPDFYVFSLITITYLLFNHIFPVFEPEIWSMITDKGSLIINRLSS